MKKLYSLSVLITFLLLTNFLSAQSITVTAGDMPTNVTACGDSAVFKVNVFGPLTSGSVITTTLPTGSSYNTLLSAGVTAVATATGVNFTLTSDLPTAADKITIEYTVNTSCTAMTVGAQITYVTGSVTKTQAYPTVDYSLLEVIGVSPSSATINVYGTQNYTVTVKQSAATYSNNVKINITHSTKVSLTAPVGILTLGTPVSGTQTDVLELSGAQITTIGDGDTRFEQNESISAVVTAKLISCTTGETLSFKAAYGCGTFNACTTGNITNAGLAQIAVANPNLTMKQTKEPRPGLSAGEDDTATYLLTNNGAGPAYNIKVKLGFSSGGANYAPVKRTYFNFHDFTVNGNLMSDDANDVAQFNFTSDPDGVGVGLADLDGDGQFDDLPAGQSVTINTILSQSINFTTDCTISYNSGNYDIIRWNLNYTNTCLVVTSYDEPNNTLGATRPLSISAYTNNIGIISSTNNNLNFSAGDSFKVLYTIGSNYSSLTKSNINCVQAFYRVKVELPSGIVPDTTSSLVFSQTGFNFTYNASVSDPANNTYFYDLIATTATDLAIYGTFTIPVVVNSTCNTNGVYSVKLSMQLYETTTQLIINKFVCTTTNTFTLGCATPVGMGIDSFDMKRQTFGYTDTTETTHVTETTSGINLNSYLNGDNAVAAYKLTIYDPNMQSANLVMEYNKDNWIEDGLYNGGIKGISGVYTDPITNVSTPFSIPTSSLSNYYTYTDSYTGTDGLLKSSYTFNILKLFQLGGPLATIIPVANAKIDININFKINEKYYYTSSIGNQIEGFNSYTPITLSNGISTIGNYKADLARVFAYFADNVGFSNSQSIQFTQCSTTQVILTVRFSSYSKFGELFPNEIRYNEKINKIVALVPAGISLISGSVKESIYGSSTFISTSDPIIEYGFNYDGTVNSSGLYNKLTFINDGSWIRRDASTSYDMVQLYFNSLPNNLFNNYIASNTTFKTKLLDGDIKYSLNFDTPLAPVYPVNDSYPLTVKMYSYTVSSAGANVTTATNTANWPLTITNTNSSGETIPNFWIAIDIPNNNITPTLWDGATQIALTSYGTGKYWAKIGNLSGTKNYTIKTSNFTVCGTDSFIVKTGYDCYEYPTNPDLGYPSQGNVTPYSKNLPMSLTTQNPALTISSSVNSSGTDTFDICNPIEETLTVTNGANGYAYNIKPQITFPIGMSYVPNSVKVTYNGTDYAVSDSDITLLSGTTYSVNIYNSGIPFATTGLPGTSNTVDPKYFELKYQVTTLCTAAGTGDYVSGSRINYKVNGESGCGTVLPLVNGVTIIRSQPVNLNGAPANKVYLNTFTSLETPNNVGNLNITDTEELQVTVINQADPTGAMETIKVFVDASYDYVVGSYSIQSGNTFSSLPSVNEPVSTVDVSGQRKLEWTIPAGFTAGETIQFNFKVEVVDPASLSCTDSKIISMNTYVGGSATCSTNGETCNLEFPTGTTQEVELIATKATIVMAESSLTSVVSGSDEEITVDYTIENTSAFDITGGVVVELFHDVNSNDTYDSGVDVLLATAPATTDILSGATLILSSVFTVNPDNVCNLLFVVRSDSNPIICTPYVLALSSPAALPDIAGADQAICEGDTATLGMANNTSYTYSWAGADAASLSSYLSSTTIAQPVFDSTGLGLTAATDYTYEVTVTRAGGCTSTDEVTITVNPSAQVDQPADQTVCNGDSTTAVTFTTINTDGTTTYSWTNDTTSIGLAPSGTGNIATFTATNSTSAPVTATITVTPSYTNGGTTCTGTAETFTITVNPIPTVNPVSDQTVCSDDATTAITFTGAISGTTYAWTNDTTSIGLAASGTGDIASFTAINSTTSPVTATITVIPQYINGGATCDGTSKTFTITVYPTPEVPTLNNTVEYCSDQTPTLSDVGNDYITSTGTLIWYDAATGGNVLTGLLPVVDGETYYAASQGVAPLYCESATRLSVPVTITSAPEAGTIQGTSPLCTTDASVTYIVNGGDAGGTWSSDDTAVATVDAMGNVSPVGAGTTVIRYTVAASGGCTTDAVATYNVTVEVCNMPPVAVDDTATTDFNGDITFNVVGNDTDDSAINAASVDLDPSTLGIQNTFTDVDGNTWSVDPAGNVTFVPAPGYVGTATVSYTVQDNEGATSNVAFLSVTVAAPTCADIIVDGDDACGYITANPTSPIALADCDGDGVTNLDECTVGTGIADPCDPAQVAGYTGYDNTNVVWQASDCDGDGVTNGNEDGNTDPYDACDFNLASKTVAPDAAWLAGDCDGDCYTNGDEVTMGTNPLVFNFDASAYPNGASTVNCAADATAPTTPTITDNCGTTYTLTLDNVSPAPACEGDIVYTYTYTDGGGTVHTWTYTYTIDYLPFSLPADGSSTVSCMAAATDPGVPSPATDNCGNPLTLLNSWVDGVNDGCQGTVVYYYEYQDCSGYSDVWKYTYTVTPVDFTVSPATGGSTVACVADIDPSVITLPTVVDGCGNTLTPTGPFVSQVPSCEGTVDYRYTYEDCAGNTHDFVYTFTVTYADFTVPADGTSTVACEADITVPAVPAVQDNCGNDLVPSGPVVNDLRAGACEGDIAYVYTYTDCAGFTHDWTYTFTVAYANFTMPADGASTVSCYDEAVIPVPPTVVDSCGTTLVPVANAVGGTYAGCEGTVIYSWDYTDCASNVQTWTYTYTIDMNDFSMPANQFSTVSCATDAVAPAAPVVMDACGNALMPTEPVQSGTYVDCEGTIVYTYTYTDCAGQAHDWVYTYTVDLPVVDLPSNAYAVVDCPADVVQPTAPVVMDACGNTLTPTFSSTPLPACEGEVVYTFTYTDCTGATYDWLFTYLIEYADFVMPSDTSETVSCPADIVIPIPPVVNDACGNPLTPTGPVVSDMPVCEGDVTYIFTYTDCEGNTHDWTHTVTVLRDEFAITDADGASTVECIADAVAPVPPVVTDACGDAITSVMTIGGDYDGCSGTRVYTFEYQDCTGFTDVWTYTYTIAPIDFTMPIDSGETVSCESAIGTPPVPSVQDNCGNDLVPSGPVVNDLRAGACEGDITYTYTFTDCSGNTHDWVYTYTIAYEDFVMPADAESTISCASELAAPTVPTVVDSCGTVLTPSTPVVSATPACEGDVTYTYTFTDCEGNTHDWVYTYHIVYDDFAMPSNGYAVVACPADAVAPSAPVVYDSCGTEITPTGPVVSSIPACEGNVTYTFTYTDCADNAHDWVFTYVIEYNEASYVVPANTVETVACPADVAAPSPVSLTDGCGNVMDPVLVDTSATPACEGQVVYTYTYTDCEGNVSYWTHTVTVDYVDFSMPANESSTVACIADAVAPNLPIVKDNCNNVLRPVAEWAAGTYDGCEGTRVYYYEYQDCAGFSHIWRYTYTIEREDFVMPANAGSTVACASQVKAPSVPRVKDNCGNVLSPDSVVVSAIPACEGDVTYTYTFTDCEGNTHDWVYTYTIEYEDFVMPADAGETISCPSDLVAPVVPTVIDHCGNVLVPSSPVISDTPSCNGDVTYTYTFTDCEGNTHDWVYTYTIDLPDFDMPADAGTMVMCPADARVVPTAPIVYDYCGNLLAPTVGSPAVSTIPDCEGSPYYDVTYTYTYEDCAGHSHDWVYTYTISYQGDLVIPANGGEIIYDVDDAVDPGAPASVTDACGRTVTPVLVGVSYEPYNFECEGKIIWTYRYTACDGLTSADWTYTYDVDACVIPRGFSPNDDGDNDVWYIPGLANHNYYTIEVYDRWGNLVWEYDRQSTTSPEWWNGESIGRITLQKGELVPAGTYFYIVNYNDGQTEPRTGWVYVNY